MSTADILAVALGADGLASTGALVYVVRRVSPWPKPPTPAVPGTPTSRRGSRQTGDGQTPAANGSDPARSTV